MNALALTMRTLIGLRRQKAVGSGAVLSAGAARRPLATHPPGRRPVPRRFLCVQGRVRLGLPHRIVAAVRRCRTRSGP